MSQWIFFSLAGYYYQYSLECKSIPGNNDKQLEIDKGNDLEKLEWRDN